MKPPPFEYHRPGTVAEALDMLTGLPNAKILAGGQSLLPMLNLRVLSPDHLIDINGLEELAGIHVGAKSIIIGAQIRHKELERSLELRRHLPILCEAVRHVGHRQIRSRGTLGGSICHLDPVAELPAMALLYGAEVHVRNREGIRKLPMETFAVGYMTPALEPDELVVAVEFPRWPENHGFGFHEVSPRKGDFATAIAGALLTFGAEGVIDRAAIVVAGTGLMPIRLQQAETMLIGEKVTAGLFKRAAESCLTVEAVDDLHSTADHRRLVAAAMVERSLAAAAQRLPVELRSRQ